MNITEQQADNFCYAIAVFRIIVDDIDLHVRKSKEIDAPSLFSSLCTTYVKLYATIPGRAAWRKIPTLDPKAWLDGMMLSFREFKYLHVTKWIVNDGYEAEDRSFIAPFVNQIMKGGFTEAIGGTTSQLPTFSSLVIRDRLEILDKMADIAIEMNKVHPDFEAIRDRIPPSTIQYAYAPSVGTRNAIIGRTSRVVLRQLADDRCLVVAFNTGDVFPMAVMNALTVGPDAIARYNAEPFVMLREIPDFEPTASMGEVFSAIGKSEFKKSLWSLLAVLKISTLAGILCDKISPSGALKQAIGLLDEVFKISSAAESIRDIFMRLFTEIIPAIWYQDPSMIKPELFSTRMDVIYKAIVAAKSHNQTVMREVIKEWDNSIDVDVAEIELAFHEVLVKMQKFVTSSSTNHLTSVMRAVINDLVIVEQQIANHIRMGTVRYEPYSVGLRGQAGIGKSTMIPRIQAELGNILELPVHQVDGKVVYDAAGVITEGVKFDENIYNTTKTITFDDMNLVAPDFQEKGSGNLAVKFLQCQGSVPFSLNKANIEEKKGSFWNNNLTIVTSNLPNYGLDRQIMDSGAWSRRIHVDIEMKYQTEEQDRSKVDYHVTYLNYENSYREDEVYHNLNDLMHDLRIHCKRYWQRRQSRIGATSVCRVCRELPHNCVCNVAITQADRINAAGLWMEEADFINSSWTDVAKTVVAEETLSYAVLSGLLYVGVHFWYAAFLVGAFREVVELFYGKDFNWFRCLVFTLSLQYFPLSIFVHFGVNYAIIVEKIQHDFDIYCLPAVAQIPLLVDEYSRRGTRIVTHAIKNECTPQWWLNWQVSRLNPAMLQEMLQTRTMKLFCGVSLSAIVVKVLYDSFKADTYIKTALGQPASEVDKEATHKLDEQIGGQAESRQDGLAMGNDWKAPMKILYRPGGQTPHSANSKCALKIRTVAHGGTKVHSNSEGFLSSEGLGLMKHSLPPGQAHILFNFENAPQQEIKISYDPDSPNNLHFNDIVIVPYTDERKKMRIRRDYAPKIGDKFLVKGTVCTFLAIGTNQKDYPMMIVLDYPGGKGLSGAMVTIIEHDGKTVENEIVGAIAAMFTNGPYKGKAAFEPFLTKQHSELLKLLPKSYVSVEQAQQADTLDKVKELFGQSQDFELTSDSDEQYFEDDFVAAIEDLSVQSHLDVAKALVSSNYNPYPGYVNKYLSPYYNYLQAELTPEILAERFLKQFNVKIVEGASPHTILGHLNRNENGDVICNIGEFVGHVPKAPAPNKSKFYKTEFYEKAKMIADVDKYVIPDLGKGVNDGVYRNSMLACARQMNSSGYIYDQSPFWSAAQLVEEHIASTLGKKLDTWIPYDIKTVIAGDHFTTAMNREAAKGFPHKGVKDDWVWGTHEEPILSKEICDEVSEAIRLMDECNLPPLNISQAALKDEIISKEKNDKGQARVFFAGNTSFLILCRAYLGRLMNLFVEFRQTLFAKIGMNAIGAELDSMIKAMFFQVFAREFTPEHADKKCWMDGDFNKYDKMLLVLKYAIHVIWGLAKRAKFFRNGPTFLNRIRLILTALSEYVIFLGDDIFIMRDKLPSGVWATALINCICEMIIEVLMFYFLLHIQQSDAACDFVTQGYIKRGINVFKYVAISNYGDDNIKCIHNKYWHIYKHEYVVRFSKWLHMGITPARKHEQSIDLKPICEILFLKRVFRWNDHLKRYVGALELESIAKMLAFSDTKNVDLWRVAVLLTARRELAFHGRDLHDKFCQEFDIKDQTWEATLEQIDRNEWKWDPEVDVPIYNIVISDLSL